MKTKLFFIASILFSLSSMAQKIEKETIIYDFQQKEFYNSKKESIKSLIKGTEYTVKVTHVNPFYYKISGAVTQNNSIKDAIGFLSEFISSGKTSFFGKDSSLTVAVYGLDRLIANYNKAVKLSIKTKNETIDCDELKSLTNDNELLASYTEYIQANHNDKNVLKQLEPFGITADNVKQLELLIESVKTFSKNECSIDLMIFTPTETESSINISFIPIDKNSIYPSITAEKKLKTQSKFSVGFSTGIMMTNVVKKLYYINDLSSTTYSLSQDERTNILPGIMGLVNISKAEDSKLVVSLGGAIDLEKTPHFLLGIGWNVLDTGILFSSGLDIGYIEGLTNKYNVTDTYTVKPEITYINTFKTGIWFGFSYKL